MSPVWSFWNLFRASLLPGGILLALSLAGAGPVEAATTAAAPQATPTGSSPERMDSAQRAVMDGRGRVKLGTLEMARLKPRSNSGSGAGAAPLVYHGGQVQEVPQIYISLWGPDWNAAGHQAAETYLQGFFGSLGGSPWLAVNSQYCSGTLAAPQTSCSGGTLSWSPAVTSTGSGQLSIFTRGSDNVIWRKDWNNGWTGLQSVGGGQWPTGPAATAPRGTGRIDPFTRGQDNALLHAQV